MPRKGSIRSPPGGLERQGTQRASSAALKELKRRREERAAVACGRMRERLMRRSWKGREPAKSRFREFKSHSYRQSNSHGSRLPMHAEALGMWEARLVRNETHLRGLGVRLASPPPDFSKAISHRWGGLAEWLIAAGLNPAGPVLRTHPFESDALLQYPLWRARAGPTKKDSMGRMGHGLSRNCANMANAGWESLVIRWAHTPEIARSNRAPATI